MLAARMLIAGRIVAAVALEDFPASYQSSVDSPMMTVTCKDHILLLVLVLLGLPGFLLASIIVSIPPLS